MNLAPEYVIVYIDHREQNLETSSITHHLFMASQCTRRKRQGIRSKTTSSY